MSENNSVSCPICKEKLLVAWNGKLFSDDTIQEKIEKHTNNHTINEIRDFIGLNIAEQVSMLEKNLRKEVKREAKP